MKLAVRHYIPNPLRCFKCQRFGHSKATCTRTLTCARCADTGHESSTCTAPEKCANCKGRHTSFSRSCSSWIFEKEVIAEKVKRSISYQEAKRLVQARTPSPGTSYASAMKKSLETKSTQIMRTIYPIASVPFKSCYLPSEICPRSESFLKAPLPSSRMQVKTPNRLQEVKTPNVGSCETVPNSQDLSSFQTVRKKKKFKPDSPIKLDMKSSNIIPSANSIPSGNHTSVVSKPECLSVSTSGTSLKDQSGHGPKYRDHILPPLERRVLQSRESDADAEMSSSSASEDALEYDMSEDLEDSPGAQTV